MTQESPVILKPSWIWQFFLRCISLPPLFIWLVWVVRRAVMQPEMLLHVSLEDWVMVLIMLGALASCLSMTTTRVVLDGDAIEIRNIFGRKRLHLSEISCRCHSHTQYAMMIVNLYKKNAPQRMFRSDMRVLVGLFSLSAGEKILQFMEPIPESDHCTHTR